MEFFQSFLRNLSTQIALFWKELSGTKRVFLVVGTLAAIAIVTSVVYISTKKEQEYLFVDISSEDSAEIANNLKATGYSDFIIDKKGIKVNRDDVGRLRMQVAEAGLPTKGVVGWEKFDEEHFTRTEFEQDIQKLRAVQGELSRTINSIEGVTSARVHIVQPKNSLFVRDQKKTTAAIFIKTKRNVSLTKSQIRGIQHIVSSSVEGLERNDVSIIDNDGNMVSEQEATDSTSKLTKEMVSYKREIEHNLEQRIQMIVGRVVGNGRIEAKVDAEVDFTQEKQTVSDVDPDKAGVLSRSTSGSNMSGTGLNPTGIPGSKSNVPGEQEDITASQSKTGSSRDSEIVNFEVSKTISEKTLPVGNIKRLTVSVLVDGKQISPTDGSLAKFEPRSEEEMKQIDLLIRNSVGFKEGRDAITVQNMLFQIDQEQLENIKDQKKEEREYATTISIAFAVSLALALFFMFIVRPYLRWLAYDPQKKQDEKFIEEFNADLEQAQHQNIQIQEDVPFEKLSPTDQVHYLAKHEPKRTTEAIRMLMNPHSQQG